MFDADKTEEQHATLEDLLLAGSEDDVDPSMQYDSDVPRWWHGEEEASAQVTTMFDVDAFMKNLE